MEGTGIQFNLLFFTDAVYFLRFLYFFARVFLSLLLPLF